MFFFKILKKVSSHRRLETGVEGGCLCRDLPLDIIYYSKFYADYNRQTAQISGKINKKICAKKLLTKLLAGCIIVNSGRDARNRPTIIPHPRAFVNRENYTKNEGKIPLIFVKSDRREMRPAFRSIWRFRLQSCQLSQPTGENSLCAMPAYQPD